ncbi:MAG TPA: helix-turn-helix domain-containing protein [Solirubrobacteraceae bacterium]|nr:helix-turn-helix domain-containing protein [Solirubrobacteraceae bacterium]
MTSVPEAPEKPLRADARRNREKVLAAARAVFAEQGVDAQMDDVARRADVGVGTVYRHFPTKDALLNALTDELFAVVAVYTRNQLTVDDPWEAFTRAMWFGAEKTAGDRAFSEIMGARPGAARTCPGKEDLLVTVGELMERCIAAGKMRPDAVVDDVGMLMCGVGSASQMEHPVPDAWRRHMAIMLDGLRAEAASAPLHST